MNSVQNQFTECMHMLINNIARISLNSVWRNWFSFYDLDWESLMVMLAKYWWKGTRSFIIKKKWEEIISCYSLEH